MTHTITFSQQNLRKSKVATFEFTQHSIHTDIILIQEPYTGPTDNKTILDFPQKSILLYDSSSKPLSGILVSNPKLYVEFLQEYSCSNITTIKIHLQNHFLIIACLYFEPNSLSNELLNKVRDVMDTFRQQPMIIAGDLNARHVLWHNRTTNGQGDKIADLIDDYELHVHNLDIPTYISHFGSSVIDLTISNDEAYPRITDWRATSQPNTIFDHKLITFTYTAQAHVPLKRPFSTKKFNEARADWPRFIEFFSSPEYSDVCTLIDLTTSPDEIDYAVGRLTGFIQDAARSSIPPRPETQTRPKYPWWTREIEALQLTVRYMRNRFSHERNPNARAVKFEEYKEIRNRYTNLIYSSKRKSFRLFLKEAETKETYGKTFRLVKALTKPDSFALPILDSSPPDQHQQKLTDLVDGIFPHDDDPAVPPDLPPHDGIQPMITPTDVSILIRRSGSKKAPGPDSITGGMLKKVADLISPPLASLFSKCIAQGFYPSEWKKSQLIVFTKPGKSDYTIPSSYRPISLISTLSKIFEGLIHSRLQGHLDENSILSPNQHGFTRNRSTSTALSGITDGIIEAKGSSPTALLSIDFTGAFDNADWNLITQNLMEYGAPSWIVDIIRSFLQDRFVTCNYNNAEYTKAVFKGCPQGSPLSPILWNVLINPALVSIDSPGSRVHAYADDLNIVCTGENVRLLHANVQRTLDALADWSRLNRLKINAQKTHYMLFRSPPLNRSIMLAGTTIQPVTTMKVLGVTFSDHKYKRRLNFNPHVSNVLLKARKVRGALFTYCKNVYGINATKRKNLYKGLVRPILAYAAEIWLDHVLKSFIKKLESFQYVVLRNSIMAFRTVSKACVTTLTGTEPIYVYLKARQDKFRERRGSLILPDDTTITEHLEQAKSRALEDAFLETNPTFRGFFPSYPLPKGIMPDYYTTQFLTGHGHYLSYLHRFGHSEADSCTCSSTPQTATHLLLHCPRYTQIRLNMNIHTFTALDEYTRMPFYTFKAFCRHIYDDIKAFVR